MALVLKIIRFLKKENYFLSFSSLKNARVNKSKLLTVGTFLVFFSGLFFISFNLVNESYKKRVNNFQEITKNNEF